MQKYQQSSLIECLLDVEGGTAQTATFMHHALFNEEDNYDNLDSKLLVWEPELSWFCSPRPPPFFFLSVHAAYGSSQPGDRICTTTAT